MKKEAKFKAASEIRKDLELVKSEIEKKKKEVDEEAEDFLNDLHKTVLSIEQQAEQKVDELDSHVKELEREMNQRYQTAYNGNEKLLSTLSRRATNYFKYTIIFFFFFSLISIYLIIPIDILRAALIILYIVVFGAFYYRLKDATKFDPEQLKKVLEALNKGSRLKRPHVSGISYQEKSPRLKKLVQTIGGALTSVTRVIPGVNTAYTEISLLAKFERKVKEFGSTLEFYSINFNNDKIFLRELGESPPFEARTTDDESAWEIIIIDKLGSELANNKQEISTDAIYLLYKEHNGQDTKGIFRKIKGNKSTLRDLASVLLKSNRLTKPQGTLTYDIDDLSEVLKSVQNFDLPEVNNIISTSLRHLDYLQSYCGFLKENRIEMGFRPTVKLVLEKIDNSINSREGQIIDLAYKFGVDSFKKILRTKELAEGFAKASVSIKFNSEPSLRKAACEISSNDIAVPVIRAFFEKGEQKGAELAILKDLIDDLDMVHKFIKSKNDWEHKFWIAQLREGMWHDNIASLNRKFFEGKLKEMKEEMKDAQKYAGLKEVVRQTFEQVKIITIERAIDAQAFSAYLILSRSSSGRFAPLIDKLSIRDLRYEIPPERRWDRKSRSAVEEIKKKYGVEPRYDFMMFSTGTWVGVLSKGEEFTEFVDRFLSDVNKIIDVEQEDFDIGLVVQRITPSKYSFGILENAEKLLLPKYVARLARDHITEEEQASLMAFDPDVNLLKILDKMSIYEMMRIKNDEFTPEEKRVLETQNLKDELLEKLKIKLGTKTYKSLALDLAINADYEKKVSNVVMEVLAKTKLRRADVFSNRFVDGLKVLALLYEAQRK